jgi:radical SAM superfamily enzyme YgiQ (UPF0313 family)
MKIYFIQPAISKLKEPIKSWQMYPLSIATLAALTPTDYEIKFTDDRFEKIDYNFDADLIVIPVETYTAQRAYYIAKKFKEKKKIVVMGGIHAMLEPLEVLEHCDSVCTTGAEKIWGTILKDFEENKLQKIYSEPLINDESLIHIPPRRDLFDNKPYLPFDIIETGRGCKNRCDFCAVQAAHKQAYRSKSIDEIISDIKSVKRKNIYFADDNFVADFKRTKELLKRMIPLKKKWFSHGSINMADDKELLELLRKSGCVNLLIGFETLNQETLRQMNKSWNNIKRSYNESIKKINDHGITIYATFCFGYDTDTKDDFKRTFDFAMQQKFAFCAFNHLMPFPNTALYYRLKKENRLFEDKWWLKKGYEFGKVVFKPKNMSALELEESCYHYRKEFYKYSSIFKRMLDFKANSKDLYNFFIIALANISSKKAVFQRQNLKIGLNENDN